MLLLGRKRGPVLLALLSAMHQCRQAECDILASSKVERCVAEGSTDVPPDNGGVDSCERKLVLAITVSNTQQSSEWFTVSSAQTTEGNSVPLAKP